MAAAHHLICGHNFEDADSPSTDFHRIKVFQYYCFYGSAVDAAPTSMLHYLSHVSPLVQQQSLDPPSICQLVYVMFNVHSVMLKGGPGQLSSY